MLKINFSPVRKDCTPLSISKYGNMLNIDGKQYDLNAIPDGATVEGIDGNVIEGNFMKAERTGNDFEITVVLPHGKDAPETTRFPVPMNIDEDGVIIVPVYNK